MFQSGLKGYVSGLPFPRPANGLEVAYNVRAAYRGDDTERLFDVAWSSARDGWERSESRRGRWLQVAGRTDIDPRPAIPSYERERYRSVAFVATSALESSLSVGAYVLPLGARELFGRVYVPALRRVLRQTFGTRADA